jgi:FtsP/CotA-like multicopper oxidase with cupredoxin domain
MILASFLLHPGAANASGPTAAAATPVEINDNRTPAGSLGEGVLTLELRAGLGSWWPEGPNGPSLTVQAFGAGSQPLQVPAPLVRVPEGTIVVARVRNELDLPLELHGLCARDGSPCPALTVPPLEARELRFAAGRPGTYNYWATTMKLPLAFRSVGDTQLSGAFVVDPAGAPADDRVLVITDWTNLTLQQLRQLENTDDTEKLFRSFDPKYTFLINGRSWPATERFTYDLNDRVRWRVVNLSSQQHPLHLHGFYFEVDELGDSVKSTPVEAAARQRVVTQLMPPGGTMRMTWTAERPGNWLFHCHIADHIAPQRQIGTGPDVHADHHAGHTMSAGMAGMVLGVTIRDAAASVAADVPGAAARKMTLEMRTGPARVGSSPAYGFALVSDSGGATPAPLSVPGPTLALRRGEPVEITLLNELPEATAIHWHGLELESYYDGVHGWSGAGAQVTPMIEPGASFTVRFTPPRTGTFIYHTHLHDGPQLTGGLYGALLVMDAADTFDPVTDHVVVIGRAGTETSSQTVLNGEPEPVLTLKAGVRHRLRFVNITPGDVYIVSLATATDPVQWCPVTKDGAPVPAGAAGSRAAAQKIAVGETYDFEYDAPPGRQSLWLNVRTPAGKWQVQGRVLVK